MQCKRNNLRTNLLQAHIVKQQELQIVIEATKGPAWAGDIAIDDVKVRSYLECFKVTNFPLMHEN